MYSLGCKLIKVGWVVHFWLLKDTYFVWLKTLTTLANNMINIFLVDQALFDIIFNLEILVNIKNAFFFHWTMAN